jgi:hypothetical protein
MSKVEMVELDRRGIYVPKTDRAESHFRRSRGPLSSVTVDVLSIEDDALFYELWTVFLSINNACGSIIDDYEEDMLEPEVLDKAIDVLNRKETHRHITERMEKFLIALVQLLQKAKETHRPVLFIL